MAAKISALPGCAAAPGCAGRTAGLSGRAGRAGSDLIRSLRPSGPVARYRPRSSSSSRFSTSRSRSVLGHARVRRTRPRQPEPPARQALLDRFQQVVGFQLLDLEVGVAHHAEGVDLQQVHCGKSASQVGGQHLLQPDVEGRSGCRARRCSGHAVPGSGTRRGSTLGTFTRAKCRRPSGSCSSTARLRLRFEMCGKGWPGSTASGVQTGKTMRSKYSRSARFAARVRSS